MEKLNKKRKISESPDQNSPEIRKEFIRLISQALYDFGYIKSAQQLEEESGISFENPEVQTFRSALLEGDWDKVSEIVPNFSIPSKNKQKVRLCVKQQKYLEQIAEGNFEQALKTLRSEVAPIHEESRDLHSLASLLLCKTTEELKENADLELDRKQILKKVQTFIPSSVMIPNSRLLVLASQALEYQIETCEKHCGFFKADTLLEDHSCDTFSVPAAAQVTLNESTEVWDVVLSHQCDKILAVCKSSSFSLWDLKSGEKGFSVNNDVTSACWSLNDQQIVTGSSSGQIVFWTLAGTQSSTLTEHKDKVTGVQFLTPSHLLTGGIDMKLVLWDHLIKVKNIEQRVRQIEKASQNNVVAVLNAAKCEVSCFKYMPFEKIITITEDDSITSIQINHSGTQILTAVSLGTPVRVKQKINLWTLSGSLIQTFEGFVQEKFIIRPCFAGPSEDLVLMGSENGKIHVWSKLHGSSLGVIQGHTGTVNALAMSCLDLSSVISCSDDGTLKLWNLDPLNRDN